jgi:hypothetical protein
MVLDTKQFDIRDGIKEIQLTGEKLEKETSSLDVVNKIGYNLYKDNKDFVREYVPENWYAVIEPLSGRLIAGANQLDLYNYTSEQFPNKIFYIIGLLKINLNKYVGTF